MNEGSGSSRETAKEVFENTFPSPLFPFPTLVESGVGVSRVVWRCVGGHCSGSCGKVVYTRL